MDYLHKTIRTCIYDEVQVYCLTYDLDCSCSHIARYQNRQKENLKKRNIIILIIIFK